jgi:hypothetical protein
MALALWAVLSAIGPLRAQQASLAAMASFPLDTQQVAYSNFAQLRSSPDYPQIREHVLYQQFRGFQAFLRSAGVDPEKDVDEVILGWRGDLATGLSGYGMASGRFNPDLARRFFTQNRLPVRTYAGADLYDFAAGADPMDIYFTFLDSSLAAFGRLHDLEAILDIRQGSGAALETKEGFEAWENELDGTSPQWGILAGKAAANVAASWFQGGRKSSLDMSAVLQPVQAVLYRVDWGGGFTAQVTLVCNSAASAAGLLKLLNIVKSAPLFSSAAGGSGTPSLLQNLDAQQDGTRLSFSTSGPAEALDQILRVGE